MEKRITLDLNKRTRTNENEEEMSSSDQTSADDDDFEREPKTDTEKVVEAMMRMEKRKKKEKMKLNNNNNNNNNNPSRAAPAAAAARDDDDDGAIKSKEEIERAMEKRKRKRVAGFADDVFEKDDDDEKMYHREEDDDEAEEEDGIKMEAFDMKKEEEEGYFDENGNYVEYEKEKKLAEDSWIDDATKADLEDFITGKKISSSARLIEAEKKAEEDEEMKMDQTEEGVAKLKRRLAELLGDSRETALKAIKRLSGEEEPNKKNKYVTKQSSSNKKTNNNNKGPPVATTTTTKPKKKLEGEDKRIFDEITTITSRLVSAGEYGAYQIEKSQLEKSANLVLKLEAKTDYEEVKGKDDMFADSDDEEEVKEEEVKPTRTTTTKKISLETSKSLKEEIKTFSIKELKMCLDVHDQSTSGGDRSDIEKTCVEAINKTKPESYVYDKSNGLYFSEASQMWWDCKANLYKTHDGNWWKYNGSTFDAASEPI